MAAQHSIRDTVWTVIRLFDDTTRRQVIGLFGWMFLGATLEMVGTALLLLFLELVAAPSSLPDRPLIGGLYRALTPDNPARFLMLTGIVVAVLFFVKNGLLTIAIWRQNQFAQDKQAEYGSNLLRGYLDAPYTEHLNRNSAELLRNIVTSTPLLFLGALLPFLEMALEGLRVIGTLAVLAFTDFWSTFATTAALGGLAWLFFRVVQRRLIAWGGALNEQFGHCYRAVNQGLGAVKEAKVLGREVYFGDRFEKASRTAAYYRIREGTVVQLPQLFLEAVVVAGLVVVIVVLVQSQRPLEQMASALSVFVIAAFRLIPSINKIVGAAAQIKASAIAIDEVAADLARTRTFRRPAEPGVARERLPFQHRIAIQDLAYWYPGRSRPALKGVNLTIQRGESVALVGSSGAGKTTLADVFLGLLEPQEGRMLVDQRDVRTDMRAWQAKIGYVPQTIYLTDDTLRRNIALGLPDELIDEDQLQDAIALAQLGPVVEMMGLDTPVGEHGIRLSGGQRQRVGIARAVYHRPEVLVLDEATSALDNVLEREVARAIQRLSGQMTIIIIAHRLSTARQCNRVALMKHGRVEDEGPFDILTQRSADMHHLVELGQLN